MKIAIVNDMAMAVEVLRRVVVSVPGYQIAWIARDGQEAVRRCAEDRPDIVLMDLLMPVMDGAEATRLIMSQSPCTILVVTATVAGNFEKVYEAMGHGALDAVNTPVLGPKGSLEGAEALLHKIATVGMLIRDSDTSGMRSGPAQAVRADRSSKVPLLLLGASTGGPQAVARILEGLPADFPVAVVLVQHVDPRFAEGFASWLGDRAHQAVRIAESGTPVQPGTIWLTATNDHAVIQADRRLSYTPDPRDHIYRPSVDVLFKSVAGHWKGRGCAVLLTGMGRDGAEGLLALRRAGFYTIAQDQKTSVVYGMPRAAAELGAANEILPIDGIAPRILDYFQPDPDAVASLET